MVKFKFMDIVFKHNLKVELVGLKNKLIEILTQE